LQLPKILKVRRPAKRRLQQVASVALAEEVLVGAEGVVAAPAL